MTEITSTVNARRSEGWRFFYRIGELYEIEIQKEPHKRYWESHQAAVDRHGEHIQNCENCVFGITRVKMELEEMAVSDGS